MTTFDDFGLDPKLLKSIADLGFVEPTPIQVQAIPVVLAGADVMGAAQTGTGKTASFGLPLLNRLLPKACSSVSPARHPIRALILTPTRELADQVNKNLTDYARSTLLRCFAVYGGVDMRGQIEQLRKGVEVLTATPGRLLDLYDQKAINLSQVEMVVLDEADRMLDMGFLPSISRILSLLPKRRQSLMFSATFSPEIKSLAKSFLNDNPCLVEVARSNATNDNVVQELFSVKSEDKTDVLIDILKTRGPGNTPLEQVLVFCNAKLTCSRLTRLLVRVGINAEAIHGDKTQEERLLTLERFKNNEVHVLVATDVAARGLDIKDLPYVINYDVPFVAEDYVHRIGRTGRGGARGLTTMLATSEDAKLVAAIESLTKQKFKAMALSPMTRSQRRRLQEQGAPAGKGEGSHCAACERVDTPEEERQAKERARAYQPPSTHQDVLFDRPYEDSPAALNRTPRHYEPFDYYEQRDRKRPVAALLKRSVWKKSSDS